MGYRSLNALRCGHVMPDEWRLCNGYSVDKSIVDLLEEADIRGLMDLLFKFILQVQKYDGSLYPPASYVQNLLFSVLRCFLYLLSIILNVLDFFAMLSEMFIIWYLCWLCSQFSCRIQNMLRAIG